MFIPGQFKVILFYFFKDLNKDLSQKLEVQTQRLELLTAQRMANENVLAKPSDVHSMNDSIGYADEGDEVRWKFQLILFVHFVLILKV